MGLDFKNQNHTQPKWIRVVISIACYINKVKKKFVQGFGPLLATNPAQT